MSSEGNSVGPQTLKEDILNLRRNLDDTLLAVCALGVSELLPDGGQISQDDVLLVLDLGVEEVDGRDDRVDAVGGVALRGLEMARCVFEDRGAEALEVLQLGGQLGDGEAAWVCDALGDDWRGGDGEGRGGEGEDAEDRSGELHVCFGMDRML